MLWNIAKLFVVSIILSFVAIFFLGGMPSVWMFVIFFGLLYAANQDAVEKFVAKWGTRASGIFGFVKNLGFSVLAVMIALWIIGNLTGITPAAASKGGNNIATLFYASLFGIVAATWAGWMEGNMGKKVVKAFFSLTFICVIGSAVLPSLPKALEAMRASMDAKLASTASASEPDGIQLKFGINKLNGSPEKVLLVLPENANADFYAPKVLVLEFADNRTFKKYPNGKFVQVDDSSDVPMVHSGDAPASAFYMNLEGGDGTVLINVHHKPKNEPWAPKKAT